MKRAIVFCFALLLISVTLAAQAVDQYRPRKIDKWPAQARMYIAECPVHMRAEQAPGGKLVAVRPGQPAESTFFQRLHLILANPKPVQITSARVTVHGLTGKGRVVPAGSTEDTSSEATRTLDIDFSDGTIKEASADVSVPGFTSVSRIDLDSLTYADGSTWSSSGRGCRAVPDPFMLLGAR